MVRGRRLRKVPQCETVQDSDLCSPDAKRKEQHRKITAFFDVEIKEQEVHCNNIDLLENNDLNDIKKEQLTEIEPITEASTPHRIELCFDAADDGPKLQETEVSSTTADEEDAHKHKEAVLLKVFSNNTPKKSNNSTKTKRRLNEKPQCKDAKDSNHKLTDFFPVRRSERKTKKTVLAEKQRDLEKVLREGIEDGLQVTHFEGKGRGVLATRAFSRGDFVVEYAGDLVDLCEAKKREAKYAQDKTAGCYMYYFKHKGVQYCVDATAESGRLGRLVNHSRNGNLQTRTIEVDNRPRLVLVAKECVQIGQELTYDYGDRSKESLKHHPWLAY